MFNIINNYWKHFILLISLVATSGSLYFSEIVGYIPCVLCWWQRIFMYPLVLLSVFLIKEKIEKLWIYFCFTIPGSCFSIYHIWVENTGVESNFCSTGVSCSIKYINWLGFITIPVLCLTAFTLINIILIMKIVLVKNSKKS